jgi:hypothetical protein
MNVVLQQRKLFIAKIQYKTAIFLTFFLIILRVLSNMFNDRVELPFLMYLQKILFNALVVLTKPFLFIVLLSLLID